MKRSAPYLILLLFMVLRCSSEQAAEVAVQPIPADQGVRTFEDFIQLFPAQTIPFELAHTEQTFTESTYLALHDTIVEQFMGFEPWSWRDRDTIPFYAVGSIQQSDSSYLLLYLTPDTIPQWNLKNITLVNITTQGKLLGRFVLGQSSTARNYHSLGTVSILQTGGMTSTDSGYLQRQTVTDKHGERMEKYTFNIDQYGAIDSEFVIKAQ